jgi:hypothetical protein
VVELGRVVETVNKGDLDARLDLLHEYLGV